MRHALVGQSSKKSMKSWKSSSQTGMWALIPLSKNSRLARKPFGIICIRLVSRISSIHKCHTKWPFGPNWCLRVFAETQRNRPIFVADVDWRRKMGHIREYQREKIVVWSRWASPSDHQVRINGPGRFCRVFGGIERESSTMNFSNRAKHPIRVFTVNFK